jgi:putative ABC transport system permease protein
MIAFALGLQRQIEAPLKRLGMLNDIHVSPRTPRRVAVAGAADGKGESPSKPVPLDEAAIERIRKLPGVRYAYPDMSLHDVAIARGDKDARSYAVAVPREIGVIDQFNEMLIAGHFFSLDDAPEVLLAESLLDNLGFDSASAAVDQPITISTAGLTDAGSEGQFEFQRKTVPVRIVGVFRPPDFGGFGPRSLGRALLMPVDLLEKLPGLVESQLWRMRREGASALDSYADVTVRGDSPAAIPRLVKAIEDQGFETQTVLSRLEDMRVAFLFIESLLTAVGSVALVIAGLGIANTLLMTVLERYEEIGLYKAIGATDGDVRLMFIAEAAVLGLVGSLAGLLLAAVVCWGLQGGVNAYLAHEGVKRNVDVFYFPWWLLASAVAISTAMSVASGLYPASRAARVDPIKALRRT